jgi:hypothetical protein
MERKSGHIGVLMPGRCPSSDLLLRPTERTSDLRSRHPLPFFKLEPQPELGFDPTTSQLRQMIAYTERKSSVQSNLLPVGDLPSL